MGTAALDDYLNLTTETQEGFTYKSFNPSLGLNGLAVTALK